VLAIDMKAQESTTFIQTSIGEIAVYQQFADSDKTPIIFLHGVYFDHHLWDTVIESLKDRTIITLDMPLHGKSKELSKNNWTLHDCADMLIEILDSLHIPKVAAVGHSWGSMTILRAANRLPEKFSSIVLCNMPYLEVSTTKKIVIRIQHYMLVFRNFYTKQAAKALFGKSSLKENPKLIEKLKRPMSILSNSQIKQTDKAVIIDAEDATILFDNLKVRTIALKGKDDYVPIPPNIETTEIEGGHISPIENPILVLNAIKSFIK
jgi:pimeloyl-ACP methyl ester carboxylesterase